MIVLTKSFMYAHPCTNYLHRVKRLELKMNKTECNKQTMVSLINLHCILVKITLKRE